MGTSLNGKEKEKGEAKGTKPSPSTVSKTRDLKGSQKAHPSPSSSSKVGTRPTGKKSVTDSTSPLTSSLTSNPLSYHHVHPPVIVRTSGFCANKYVQGAIVALVAVMTFCLIAMSVLYILDYNNNRQSQSPYSLSENQHSK